ncbi:ABC transporter substrate-binding protein [Micromonospora sp. WMMD1120]|uniref:ABC transporter substrate-binding protein n=1 Tax=Micromonospora sp. WMMD1120 TaxID=3016106 RepID=UPI002415BF24|nr:ABC transporter substrate-binding protein [Micromonospora sp. WMMD1120]MDG4810785.1 ABC transporter substrate-binding protein [Micromonospora sp. WMMD1120]
MAQDLTNREHTRWRVRTIASLTAAAAILTGCTGPGGSGGGDSATPRAGGTLTFATDADPGCLDPHQSPAAAALLTGRGVVDSLVAQDPRSGDIVPWLAESWTADDRATTYTFTLRTDATFSDGSPVDAAAVKANFDRIVAPATKSLLAAGLLAGYTGATVTGERTLEVRFSQPNAGFLQAASTAFLGIQAPGSFAAGPPATCRKVVGSGPFTVSEYVPQQRVTLARRDGYRWAPRTAAHQGDAFLEKVTLSIAPDNGVRSGSLRSGQVDAVGNVTPRDAVSLEKAGFDVHRREQAGIAYSLFVNSAKEPWTDARLRRAVASAVDSAEIVKTLYLDQYSRAGSVLTPTTPGYRASEPTTSAAEAGALLDAAGWTAGPDGIRSKDGQRLSLRWTYVSPAREQRDLLAQLVQQQLRRVGVEVRLDPAPIGDVIRRQTTGDWQLNDISFLRADADVLRTALQSSAGGRPPIVPDPVLAAALADGAGTLKPDARRASYERAQQRIAEEALAIPIYNPTYLMGTSDRVRAATFDAQGLPQFYDTWLDR